MVTPAAGESSARVTSTRWALPALEAEQADEAPDRDRLLDQRGEELRGRHRDVDPPALVEEPLVLRVVDPWRSRGGPRTPAWRAARRRGCPRRRRSRPPPRPRVAMPAASREATSQASATTQVTSRSARRRATRSGSCSMTQHVVAPRRGGPRRSRSRRCRHPRWRPSSGPRRRSGPRPRSRPPACDRSVGDRADPRGAAPPPGSRSPPCRPAGRAGGRSAPLTTTRWRTSPSWPTRSAKSRPRHACPGDRDQGDLAGHRQVGEALAGPALWELAGHEGEPSGRVRPLGVRLARQQATSHLVDRPRHGGDGRDPEAQVDLGAPRVVDTGDDVGDLVGFAGDPGSEDVRVVAARDGGECAGLGRVRSVERAAVEARSDDGRPRPALRQAAEGLRVAGR